MTSATVDRPRPRRLRDALMPASADGWRSGFAAAAVVHLGLLIFLAFGVSWRSSPPAAVEAELWSQVPVAAAPRAVEPAPIVPTPVPTPAPPPPVKPPPPAPERRAEPPPPREAEIALEQRRKELAEKEAREAKERDRREAAAQLKEREREREKEREKERERDRLAERQRRDQQAKAQAESEKAAAAQREANLQRILGQAGASGAPDARGQAAQSAGPSATYAGRIKAAVKPNIVFPDTVAGNPVAEVEVRAGPTGTILGRTLVRSSGIREWDEAVLRAIDRTETLPRDVDGRVPSSILISFRPRD